MGYSDFKRKKTNSPTDINSHLDTVMRLRLKSYSNTSQILERITVSQVIYLPLR